MKSKTVDKIHNREMTQFQGVCKFVNQYYYSGPQKILQIMTGCRIIELANFRIFVAVLLILLK
jgi:hypothetical protein